MIHEWTAGWVKQETDNFLQVATEKMLSVRLNLFFSN